MEVATPSDKKTTREQSGLSSTGGTAGEDPKVPRGSHDGEAAMERSGTDRRSGSESRERTGGDAQLRRRPKHQKSPKAIARAEKRKTLYAKMVNWLLDHQGTPHSVALGFAVGMFVALTPTVGVQMILGAAIAQLLRANRLLPVALAWITNPFTIVPIYYFNYRVGQFFMGGDSEKGRQFIESLSKVSLLDFQHFVSTMGAMLSKFGGIALVLWVGSLIVATVAAAISYPVVRRIVEVERRKLAKLGHRPVS